MSGFSGPMFETDNAHWKSDHRKAGAHYNTYALRDPALGVAALKAIFPEGEADYMNFVLFSTSGVHGMYTTLEEIEVSLTKYGNAPRPEWEDDGDEDAPDDHCGANPEVTFLVVHPRIVCLRYGNAVVTLDDLPYLKKLRASSWAAVQEIGAGA